MESEFVKQRIKDIRFYESIRMFNYAKALIKDLKEKNKIDYYNMKGE